MASSHDLHAGSLVTVTAGPYKDLIGAVIDPKAVPDGLPNQRKVLVHLNGVEETYVLPRLLSTELPSIELPSAPVAKEAPTRCRECNGIGWILP